MEQLHGRGILPSNAGECVRVDLFRFQPAFGESSSLPCSIECSPSDTHYLSPDILPSGLIICIALLVIPVALVSWCGTHGTLFLLGAGCLPVSLLTNRLMQADSQEDSHPVVQQHNGDIASILESFDTITYCKGASVLRMLSHCVGPDRFLEGIGAFVVAHQYRCATQEDLWKAVQVRKEGWGADCCPQSVVSFLLGA